MRILFLTGSPEHDMTPPQLSNNQVVAGPDWPDSKNPEGQWISIKTSIGNYNVADLLEKLPTDQQPDAIVSLVDASWRNKPRNLAAFRGPKALLVADTHHMSSPLIGMFRYAAEEPYDRIIFLYDRHHLSFFKSAGFDNLYWFPGLTFPHTDDFIKAFRLQKRKQSIAFVGQSGEFHPRRVRLLEALKSAELPLDQRRLTQRQSIEFYGSSSIGFNASLNGDLNLRIFEILASGATLVTDRLTPESGLSRLLTEGKEVITYGSINELIERVKHTLANPSEAAVIGCSGAALFDRLFNAPLRRSAFQDLLVNGTAVPAFAEEPNAPTRVYFAGNTDQLVQAMVVYEGVQELHRAEESIRIVLTPKVESDIADIWATLPRLDVVRGTTSEEAQMTVFSREDEIILNEIKAPRIWCCDAIPDEFGKLNELFSPVGFLPESMDVALLYRTNLISNLEAKSKIETEKNLPRESATDIAPDSQSPPNLLYPKKQQSASLANIPEHDYTVKILNTNNLATQTYCAYPPRPPNAPNRPWPIKKVGKRHYITFGGEVYDNTTALIMMLAPALGADVVHVYDDKWLLDQRPDFFELNRWLWDHPHKRGFGWYAWKPFILLDAFERASDGDIILYTDADTFPIDDFSNLYNICSRDGGIMLFKAGGNVNDRFRQSQWCKRDCYIIMNQDEPRYYKAEAGVARFMLFQKGQWRAHQFLMEWLTYCLNPLATTFDRSLLATEKTEFVEHRTEQAIMTNLAHKYNLKLYREACELGNNFPEDKDLYPQLFSQQNPWGNKTAPCVGSKFRNVT